MLKIRWTFIFSISVGLVFALMTLAPANQRPPRPGTQPAGGGQKYNEIIQQFPIQGPMQTAWKIHWRESRGPGLIIVDAFFKKSPTDDWLQVIGEARLAESFVPYHRGSPRFWDVSYNFPLNTLTPKDAGAHGKLLSSKPGKAPTVMLELKDQGIAWKDSAGVRRGEYLALWGSMSAANYRYLMEYTFRDDGLIRFRLGSTGHNYPGSEWEPHMHNAWWRVDVNLDGPDHNSVEVCEVIEPNPNGTKAQAVMLHTPFNNDKEGTIDFDADKFTMLRIYHTKKKNIRNQPWTYDLVPYRMGNSRHYANSKEACSQHDFWVTKNRPGEIYYHLLPKYITDPNNPKVGENVHDTDVVIWYSAPGPHDPRSEDGEMRKGAFGRKFFRGVTPIMWTTFELRPRDIWDRSPFFPYGEKN